MKKVLHVVSTLGSGGVESLLYNYYMNMDREKVRFDFIVHSDEIGFYEKKFVSIGSKVFHVKPRRVNFIENVLQIKKIIKNNNYDVIHAHLEHMSFIPLYYGQKFQVETRIAHAHLSNQNNNGFFTRNIFSLTKKMTKKYSTEFLGCSKDSLVELFGEDVASTSTNIMKNAIDLEKFSYNEKSRNTLRTKLKIENNFVIGHIGRFTDQKNHEFLINIFKEVHDINNSAKLILVGEGPLKANIQNMVNRLGLHDNVLFLGVRDDINNLMCAFDTFVFPSNYEGLGIVLIESQACALHTFTSLNVVPQEANITNFIKYLPLYDSPKEWAEMINGYSKGYDRKITLKEIAEAGYDIKIQSKILENLYRKSSF